MKHFKIVMIGMLLCAFWGSCQKSQEQYKEPKVTEKAPEISATQVSFEWTVDYPGKICSQVEISRDEYMIDATRYGSDAETDEKVFKVVAANLDEATQYYYRYVVWNPNNHFEMDVKSFTTKEKTKPTVVTVSVTNIMGNSATCECEVTDDGGAEVTERGVCWGTNPNPDVSGSHASNGQGLGTYTVDLTGLTGGRTYYVRAYAVNSKGTSYGDEQTFYPHDPGTLKGVFTVSYNDDKVFFSQGNLQYQPSSKTWRFADQQYDYIGEANSNIASGYTGWIDLFGWGTSRWLSGANCFQPWSTSNYEGDYYPGGIEESDLTGDYANADWGVYNAISNGGNQAGMWRTLTADEWSYLFYDRETASGLHFVMAYVNLVCGVILLPDDWDRSIYDFIRPDDDDATYFTNSVHISEWSTLEQYGLVFLPAAGRRDGTTVYSAGAKGFYWSSTHGDSYSSRCIYFDNSYFSPEYGYCRAEGLSVRLVRSIQ